MATSNGDVIERYETQFRHEVFPEEFAYIRKRWKTVYANGPVNPTRRGRLDGGRDDSLNRREQTASSQAPSTPEEAAATPTPDARRGLMGLAFSGGGIRSATINLGITQALHRHGALDHADYMSTVSGGGYLGSSLSTIQRDGAEFPFDHVEGTKESPYLTWLRNHSNYLAERGMLDYARMFAVLLRGILVNFLVLVPE